MTMRRLFSILLLISIITIQSCAGQKIKLGKVLDGVLNQAQGGSLTNDEVVSGLKEALQVGINKGADSASKVNGFYLNPKIKIPFPPEVQRVETALRKVGLGSEVDKFVLSLNRGAEEAAKEAKPIFIKAILSMSFSDAWGILRGDKNAATMYLKRTTSTALIEAFSPIVERALQKTQATKYYSDLANTYNALPFTQKVNPDLKGYATQKAIDGLFILVEEEEAKIRANPLARTTEILKRVFGAS
ncbi:hypothetical protein Emtol_4082 [Emticicia oligotrophica DSM 17448]|uniref:DUF4197 domain-containing protein n=1 Tax=Emticicia oligotrophica (strain DSM 17448 / CIP 109782 / MTCC 6937 / GPTSA100-15) TaxID=929562 RepID=A0ABM5N6X2_EMTOG|nr:hypothetical protein Emtol_4082 [Emticicia oligotrophica DSM 17448]